MNVNPTAIVSLLLVGLTGAAFGITTWKGAESGNWDIRSNWAGGFPGADSTIRLNHDNQTNAYTITVRAPAITDKLWIDTYGDIPVHVRVSDSGSLQLNSMRMGFKEGDRISGFTIDGGSVWGLNPSDPAITNTAFLVGNNPDCVASLRVLNNGRLSVQGSNGLIVASSKESTGRLMLTNGLVQIRESLILGKGPGSTGEMTIAGSSSVSVTGALHIAKLDNGALMPTGTVHMAGGTLDCGTLNIGAHGSGSFSQTGGSIRAGIGGITIGLSNADGRLNMNGGALFASNSFLNIGHTDSTGIFSMSNGTVNVAGTIGVGSSSRGVGRIDLYDGSVSANRLTIGEALSASGILNLCGGGLLIHEKDDSGILVSNGWINLQQTVIQWANSNLTDWVTNAVSEGTVCFTNGFAPGTYSSSGYDGRLVCGESALYWDNLDNGSQFAHSAIWVEQVQHTAYEIWAADYHLTGSDPAADPDSDGLDNLTEYGLGGNPTNAADVGILPTIGTGEDGGAAFEYIYRRRTDAEMRGLHYALEQTTSLVPASWTNAAFSIMGVRPEENGFDVVTNHIPTDLSAALYIRLRISLE